ncbi:hypothetical protein M976_00966 [Buttiauxella ferragutiae ATCC 51602]|jgi:hypothetical protein|uniref:DUF5666 domain-containing protein n=1 Tax=Buttiauxella ferragutiae ATCC 51602 TaxID=1354252 RepID=A0ABX2WC65_9ENTR|nr:MULTISPECIES: DUF5666 domain-containing protein [Buttiauxella]AYN28312.1 hypothetical protein D8682_15815 [Buttiauxella sp. 3AFRM03]MCE0827520.1 DUF5666 domain-containing protein [Buttiauxella ferragutiae]OAT30583.1 hypothetical protein M976_00966 [Buttiauxella ferragutiae ATCC 51602]TDN49027.1 hypothetical protein EC843_10931 [Buttiauxella sp. JUb87]
MLKHRLSALLLSVLMLSTGVVAAQVDNVIRPIRGTIDSVNDHSVIITTRQGEKLDVVLTDKTKVNSISEAKISDIKPDSFIGTAAVQQADGTLKALEVHVFAPSLRGSGEGFNPFESADGNVNTMTNGTVGKLVNSQGRTMTVKVKDMEKTVIVPDDVPVVLITPGSRNLLQPGTKVMVHAAKDDKGQLVARGISAGKNGLTPPM